MHRIIEQGDRNLRRLTEQAQSNLGGFWRTAKESVKGENKNEKAELRALEVMPEVVKLLYTRSLVDQALVDGGLDPREVANVYVFMSRISLEPTSREKVRAFLAAEEASQQDIVGLSEEIISKVREEEQDVIVSSLVKDMLWISRADGDVSSVEMCYIKTVAEARFGDKADKAIQQAEDTIENEEAYIRGDISISEFEKRIKQTASQAAALGLPIAAIYFSGSVVGLSAAGFTSGLAALGLGGVLGLSAMLTGVGVVIVGGVVVYHLARHALGVNERELEKKREHMIQEILKRHQKAMADLADDISSIAMRMEEYMSRSDHNEARLARLKSELQMFKFALSTLKVKEENLENQEQQYAT